MISVHSSATSVNIRAGRGALSWIAATKITNIKDPTTTMTSAIAQ
ncbi:MAG TPA: hypothetical protein VJ301_01560 [Propionibacteriaceae bacterium]|nr:hypothetical protein [Propionibacteriaceae bacterium]